MSASGPADAARGDLGRPGTVDELTALRALETVPPERVVALWDALEPARIDDIAGSRWRGTGLDTGHPMFAMLGQMNWWGKDFSDPRKVDPILVTDDSGQVVPDTSATGGGGASLWEVAFRGRPTASMVYDRLPVIDHFAVVDSGPDGRPATLLAVMNGRGTVTDGEHFWFVLEREN